MSRSREARRAQAIELQMRADIALANGEEFAEGRRVGRVIAAGGLQHRINQMRAEKPETFRAFVDGQTAIAFMCATEHPVFAARSLGLLSGLEEYHSQQALSEVQV